MLKICATCAVGYKIKLDWSTPATHECHANPPTIDLKTGFGGWPRVVSSDKCGEWRERG